MSYAGMVAESARPGVKAHGPHDSETKEMHLTATAVHEPFGVGIG